MKPLGLPVRFLTAIVTLTFAIAGISSCESVIGDLAGGGTGGTGVSTGAITGFGSVVMNGANYKTDSKTKKTVRGVDRTGHRDQDVFSVGMVVTLHHSPGDNNATEIDYEPNLVGPIGAKAPPGADPQTIMVLDLPVIVDNATLFAGLNPGDVIEASGFVDNVGQIRATFVAVASQDPREFEIRGFISGLNTSDSTFRLGPLPDVSGYTVTVAYTTEAIQGLPGGPADGMYVRVGTTDRETVNGKITAIEVARSAARTEFAENATVVLEGLVTKLGSGSGNTFSFDLEGKLVQTDGSTVFVEGPAEDIRPNVRVQVHGKEVGGTLFATQVVFPR